MSYSQADVIAGQVVINSFLQSYKKYNSAEITQSDLLNQIVKGDQNNYLAILGRAFKDGINSDFTVLEERMDRVAKVSSGSLPTSGSLISAMSDETSIVNIVSNALSGAASDVASGVNVFSENSLFLVSTLNKIFPFLIIGGLIYFIYVNREKVHLK